MTGCALFALASFVPFCPWLVRNYVEFHQPVLGTTLNGYNLYRENYQLAQSSYLRYVGGDEADRAVAALVQRRTDLNGTVNEAQMDGVYRAEALQSIKAKPLRYLALSGARGDALVQLDDTGGVWAVLDPARQSGRVPAGPCS